MDEKTLAVFHCRAVNFIQLLCQICKKAAVAGVWPGTGKIDVICHRFQALPHDIEYLETREIIILIIDKVTFSVINDKSAKRGFALSFYENILRNQTRRTQWKKIKS